MKNIALLGSTGSIGKQTLAVIRENKDLFSVITLASFGNDLDSIEKQIDEFHPKMVAIYNSKYANELKKRRPNQKIVSSLEGLIEAATYSDVQLVVSAISGTMGLLPTYKAIEAGKTIALANKEVLVSGGEIIMKKAKECNVNIIPVDSEHNAIFQCLQKEDNENRSIEKILLTASGGPFNNYSLDQLKNITLSDALKHPTYSMGKKNTIDSSTLMNKGLEIIEAKWLFDVSVDQIKVVVHPQSIIHSMVTFIDGSTLAQMSFPDMKIPIRHALHYPVRKAGEYQPFDFSSGLHLDFMDPDFEKFPCLRLAIEAIKTGKSMPCFMNAANEVLVNRFINKEISWHEIGSKLSELMSSHSVENVVELDALLEIDLQAKAKAKVM